jgi:hypothetical protein
MMLSAFRDDFKFYFFSVFFCLLRDCWLAVAT